MQIYNEIYEVMCLSVIFSIQIKTDNHSTCLSTCASSVLLRSAALCCHIFLVDQGKSVDSVCICKTQNVKIKLLHGILYREFDPALPPSLIFILTESQVNQMSFEESREAYIRICHIQVLIFFSFCNSALFSEEQCSFLLEGL